MPNRSFNLQVLFCHKSSPSCACYVHRVALANTMLYIIHVFISEMLSLLLPKSENFLKIIFFFIQGFPLWMPLPPFYHSTQKGGITLLTLPHLSFGPIILSKIVYVTHHCCMKIDFGSGLWYILDGTQNGLSCPDNYIFLP